MKATLGAVACATALGVGGIAPASAASVSPPEAEGFAGPLQFAVGYEHNLVVAQDFSATLTVVDDHHSRKDLVSRPGKEIAGVAVTDGWIVFTAGGGEHGAPASTLERRRDKDGVHKIADLLAFERNHNPDKNVTYGFVPPLSNSCARQWPTADAGPPTYKGIVDSHAYSVDVGNGGYYVADAAGNDILWVTNSGSVKVVSMLPPQPTVITQAAAQANHLPRCTVGKTYRFEPVPTDVEVGPGGWLYVSTLPGGPEDPSLGARGSVWRINPHNGSATRLATGLAGATNVAGTGNGQVYAPALFSGRVDRIANGHATTIASLKDPAGLEYRFGKLYVSWNVFDNGKISTINI